MRKRLKLSLKEFKPSRKKQFWKTHPVCNWCWGRETVVSAICICCGKLMHLCHLCPFVHPPVGCARINPSHLIGYIETKPKVQINEWWLKNQLICKSCSIYPHNTNTTKCKRCV